MLRQWRWPAVGLLVAVAVAGVVVGSTPSGGGRAVEARAGGARSPTSALQGAARAPSDRAKARVRAALRRGVVRAQRLGGRAVAAAWVDGWGSPVTASSGAHEAPSRMWSMSKAVTAVAVYELDPHPSSAVSAAMARALKRSENCRQRVVVLALQRLAHGGRGARERFVDVLRQAGVPRSDLRVPGRPADPDDDAGCGPYLESAWPRDPRARALQLGTSTWYARDAVGFALGLAKGSFGAAGRKVFALLQVPKAPSEDPGVTPDQYTVASQSWGAGNALRRWHPAYKSGWGGAAQRRFMVGQIVAMRIDGVAVGLVALFHPSLPAATDDPGKTVGPRAIETIFDTVAAVLPGVAASR